MSEFEASYIAACVMERLREAVAARRGEPPPPGLRPTGIIGGRAERATGCSRADLELLVQLQILTGIDGYPMLTAIGLYIPGLLRDHESRESARQVIGAPTNYTVRLDDRTVFHARTAAVFRIEEDGTLSTLFDKLVPQEWRDEVIAGAREALRLYRERDPRVVGNFVRR
jgi:hypothetical protein